MLRKAGANTRRSRASREPLTAKDLARLNASLLELYSFPDAFNLSADLAHPLSMQGEVTVPRTKWPLINQLRPHVGQAIKNGKAMTRLRDTLFMLNQTLEALRQGVVAVTPEGRILWDTPEALRLLDAYGLRLGRRSEWLPSRLRAWMNRELSERNHQMDGFALCKPLMIERGESTLAVRLRSEGQNVFLLLEESRAGYIAKDLALLGLSPRETEILVWVVNGKTNSEIGTILGISPRTVQKHLERIYGRLGVENRHAAIHMALSSSKPS
jgi:DNA-binding CsgD family transcriptional regulator